MHANALSFIFPPVSWTHRAIENDWKNKKEKFEITQKCMKKSRERKNEKQNLNKIKGNL